MPKVLPDAEGRPGARNDLRCVSLEHKLGIKASPTCVMSYGDDGGALGFLVGEENRGMEYMFTMMNNARLSVGLQGLAIGERAYQDARAYALERLQGRAVGAPPGTQSPIVEHPDVRRMLLHMRALVEAMRCLVYLNAESIDLARHGATEELRTARLVSGSYNGVSAAAAGLFRFNGADRVTIDGNDPNTSAGSYLTFRNTNTTVSAFNPTINFINDATDGVVRYCTVEGASRGTSSAPGGVIRFSTAATSGTITSAGRTGSNIARSPKPTADSRSKSNTGPDYSPTAPSTTQTIRHGANTNNGPTPMTTSSVSPSPIGASPGTISSPAPRCADQRRSPSAARSNVSAPAGSAVRYRSCR